MDKTSHENRIMTIALLTFSILLVGVALDVYLHKSGQLFSATGAVLIIYAVLVWRKEKHRLEQINQTYFRLMAESREKRDAINSQVDEALESVRGLLSTIRQNIDDELQDSEKTNEFLILSFATHGSLLEGLTSIHKAVIDISDSNFEKLNLQKTLDDVHQTFVKTETILAIIGTAVWGFGAYIFEAVNYFL